MWSEPIRNETFVRKSAIKREKKEISHCQQSNNVKILEFLILTY